MKALPFKIPKADNRFIRYQVDIGKNFFDKFHQHEEIQISLIVNGSGTLVMGDSIYNYKHDDIFVLGGKLPHLFTDDERCGEVKMVSIFFNLHLNRTNLFELEELQKLSVFVDEASCGFKIQSSKNKLKKLLLGMKNQTKIQSFISFLKLLDTLRLAKKEPLSIKYLNSNYTNLQGERMQNVINYTLENYRNNISIDLVAEVANLSRNAFCKYFKKHTNKAFFTFVNELRTNYAANILISEVEKPIIEIAEISGFNNLSNFNRQFKKYTGKTPKQLRHTV